MADQLIHFDARKPVTRITMILGLVLTLLGSWFVVRWYMGNTFAEFLNPEENGLQMGRRAVSLAPNDPLTHWRLGEVIHKKLPPDQVAQVVDEYQKAASLSPNDYRFWMDLGPALEQLGESERAEKALRRAVALAPSYAYPHWYLGNFLLRAGSYEEAFDQLRRASDASPELRSQLFNLAWEVYKEDFTSLKVAVGTSPSARAEFVQYLLSRQRIEDGILLWKTLSDTEKRANLAAGESIITTLIGAKRYHQAAEISNDLVPTPAHRALVDQILNGGFEENLVPQPATVFGWQVKSLSQVQIAIDPNRGHSGSRSLRIVFQVRLRIDSLNLAQLVLVEPEKKYEVECYVRTENLQSGVTPFVEIVDAMDGSVLAASPATANGNRDWQPLAMSFKSGPKTEAVTIRINRGSCQDQVCPIFGTVWYDDFNLKRRG
jgi:tetratricopeptide (TPR) repeat protein